MYGCLWQIERNKDGEIAQRRAKVKLVAGARLLTDRRRIREIKKEKHTECRCLLAGCGGSLIGLVPIKFVWNCKSFAKNVQSKDPFVTLCTDVKGNPQRHDAEKHFWSIFWASSHRTLPYIFYIHINRCRLMCFEVCSRILDVISFAFLYGKFQFFSTRSCWQDNPSHQATTSSVRGNRI